VNYRQTPPLSEHLGYSPFQPGLDLVSDVGADGDSLDVRSLLLTFWRRKWVIVAAVLVGLALAYLVVRNTQPRYAAEATVIFEPQRLNIVEMPDVVDEESGSQGSLQNQVEILRSSSLLEAVAERLELDRTPEFNPELRVEAPPLVDRILEQPSLAALAQPHVDRLVADSTTPAWLRNQLARWASTPAAPETGVEEETPEEEAAREEARYRAIVRTLNENLELTPVAGSSVIELSYSSTNPALAATIVNAIGEGYISYQISSKRDDVAAVMEMMRTRVAELEARLTTSREAVEQARIALAEEQGQSPEVTTLQLDTLNQTLAGVQIERAQLQGRYDRAAGALREGRDLWAVNEFRQSPTIAAFRQQEIGILDELTALGAISGRGDANPQRTVLQARLEQVRRNITEEARYVVAALEFELNSKLQEEQQLEKMVAALEITAIEQTKGQLEIDQLEREALANQTLYESFLARMKEIGEQNQLQTPDARFLSRADLPQAPDSTSRNRLRVAAGGGGLLIGLALALLLERMNTSYRDPAEIQERTGLPLLAAIPQTGRRRRQSRLIAHLLAKQNGTLAESIRNLRTSVLFSDPDSAPKVVMFTSSVPEEGKSTTAMLVAVTSQQMGRSAVIVDCDFRRKTLARMISSEPDRPGLVALLEGRCELDEALLTEPTSGLKVLAQGLNETVAISPADILASTAFADVIDTLRVRFDLVILDTPPALAVTDSRLLARLSDAVVYLVRWNHTSKNAVREGLRELTSMKANVVGTGFTMVSQSKAAKYTNNEYFYRQRYGAYVSG
jgi:succinoglycan biosynthesis transport protein ExoP